MKNSYKAALLAALGLATASVAQAAGDNNNTLWLGFTGGSTIATTESGSDVVLDLGLATQFTTTSTVDLSSYLTSGSFNSLFDALSSANSGSVNFSVVGGNNTFGHGDVFGSQATSSTITETPSSATLTAAAGQLPQTDFPSTIGTATALSSQSFFGQVRPGSGVNFVGKSGVAPEVALSSGIVTADLWEVTPTADVLEGAFTFNRGTDSLVFNGSSVAVPEPTTYGLLAGAGLLLVSLRSRFVKHTA